MGLFDIFSRKKKGKVGRKEERRKAPPPEPEAEPKTERPPAQTSPTIKEMEASLRTERARAQEQERRLKQMEESMTRLQAHWMDMMQKQQRTFEALLAERSVPAPPVDGKDAIMPLPESQLTVHQAALHPGVGEMTNAPNDQGTKAAPVMEGSLDRLSSPILKDKTFSNFVVDDSNRFPFLAAEAVASGTGRRYNPLFIFGPVGAGKTHLLQAIANRMTEREPGLRVLYTSTEKLTDELIRVLDAGDMSGFRKRYDEMDVLLIDDIQMLSGKQRTQMEFFHMFNHLYNSQKQIVLCSDRPPADIEELETRLRSRFEGGLIIDIKVPTFEGRKQILVNLAQREGFSISGEVLDYLAFYLDSSVRELEGGFNRVTAFASLMKEPITVNLAMKVLDTLIRDKEQGMRESKPHGANKTEVVHEDDGRRSGPPDLDLEEEAEKLEIELLQEIRKSVGPNNRPGPRGQ